jgi:elongation factor G
VPDDSTGDVMGDLSSKRGKIQGMDPQGRWQIIKAQVPLAELYKYSVTLRSLTQGRGVHKQQFSHYEEVPRDFAEKVIQEAKKQKEDAES